MNIKQAHKELIKGNDVRLKMRYFERVEHLLLEADVYGGLMCYNNLLNRVNVAKEEFRDISTFYSGNKKNCKFAFVLAS